MTIIDESESPEDCSAEEIDVLPSGDSTDVHISDTTEPQPSSSPKESSLHTEDVETHLFFFLYHTVYKLHVLIIILQESES